MKKDKEIMSGVVKAGPKPRWTITIKDNEKGNVDVHDTNVICGAFKNFYGPGVFSAVYAEADIDYILETVGGTMSALKKMLYLIDKKAEYKALLEFSLKDVEAKNGQDKTNRHS